MKKGKKEIDDQLKDLIIPDDNEMKEAWENFEEYKHEYPKPDMNFVWENVNDKIKSSNQVRTIPFYKKLLRYAAILIPLLILGSGIYYTIYKINNKLNYITYNAPSGVRSKINLSDGSTIWLQPNSQLKYPKSFKGDNREVFFFGQGYFQIAKNEEKPFIVHTNEMDVTVLGTQFYIKAKRTASNIETGLISGSVKLSAKNISKVLEPNDIVTFSKTNKIFSEFKNITNNTYQWENGSLVFDNCEFETMLKDIADWYNLDLDISSTVNVNTNITLTIREESVSQIMEILKRVVPIDYKIEKNKVKIYKSN